ncbi:DUF5348 domain-containing protein [Bacillus sp. APMAM]|nr:DUF5348 domain-containing protein [Bacillus sp. APMAM]RTZ51713.1 hypothetical protein EKO25_25745 [Bacillus sp. SAJ1]
MILRGILVFDHRDKEWRVWIGQQAYRMGQGDSFELRIRNKYFQTHLQKDLDWFVTLDYDVTFILHTDEVYKIRIEKYDYIPVDSPF